MIRIQKYIFLISFIFLIIVKINKINTQIYFFWRSLFLLPKSIAVTTCFEDLSYYILPWFLYVGLQPSDVQWNLFISNYSPLSLSICLPIINCILLFLYINQTKNSLFSSPFAPSLIFSHIFHSHLTYLPHKISIFNISTYFEQIFNRIKML